MLSVLANLTLAKALRQRHALVLALLLVFSVQMVTATQHDHGLLKTGPDCVKCYMAAHLPGTLPAAPLLTLAGLALLLHYLLLASKPDQISRSTRITPPPRGPPAY